MKYTTNIGNSGSQYHDRKVKPSCPRTIADKFKLPDAIKTVTSAKPIAISYETICAADRRQPRNAYLELEAQPAMMTP